MTADATFEHSDLVLATTILLLAEQEGEMVRKGKQVFWSYPTSDDLIKLIGEFRSSKCLVEPLSFAKTLRITRSKVYDLMEYHPPRVKSQSPETES